MGKKKAGCVPVRRLEGSPTGEWEVLLVQSRWTHDVWLFPKGGVEPGESSQAAAERETAEEGGVAGRLGPNLGAWSSTRSADHRLRMWLLFVTTQYSPDCSLWKERAKRLRAWHTFDSARRVLSDLPPELRRPHLLDILQVAQQTLNGLHPHVLSLDRGKESADDDGPEK